MKISIDNTCPICGHGLKSDESLSARYLPAYNWWAIEHNNVGQTPRNICAQAGFQFDTDASTDPDAVNRTKVRYVPASELGGPENPSQRLDPKFHLKG